MRILYVVTESSNDERSIMDAFRKKGHYIEKVFEDILDKRKADEFDILLFNHTRQLDKIRRMNPTKVAWVFDLVTHFDYHPELLVTRRSWATSVTYIADVAFFTDGDFVSTIDRPNTYWLSQGAQDTNKVDEEQVYDLLFAASVREPTREKFLEEMKSTYQDRLKTVINGERVFGRDFASYVASSKIIVAPNTPVKPNYWSNRVWMVLGYGGFLLHPYVEGLAKILKDKKHLVYYDPNNMEDLHQKISYYLEHEEERNLIAAAGWEEVKKKHTYVNRVEKILQVLRGVNIS